MKLYDKEGNTYIAHAEKKPLFRHINGRTWDTDFSRTIDGNKIDMVHDTSWGTWFHFELNGRWYRIRIFSSYKSDELPICDVHTFFTKKAIGETLQ